MLVLVLELPFEFVFELGFPFEFELTLVFESSLSKKESWQMTQNPGFFDTDLVPKEASIGLKFLK
jgi:hypothetical protein